MVRLSYIPILIFVSAIFLSEPNDASAQVDKSILTSELIERTEEATAAEEVLQTLNDDLESFKNSVDEVSKIAGSDDYRSTYNSLMCLGKDYDLAIDHDAIIGMQNLVTDIVRVLDPIKVVEDLETPLQERVDDVDEKKLEAILKNLENSRKALENELSDTEKVTAQYLDPINQSGVVQRKLKELVTKFPEQEKNFGLHIEALDKASTDLKNLRKEIVDELENNLNSKSWQTAISALAVLAASPQNSDAKTKLELYATTSNENVARNALRGIVQLGDNAVSSLENVAVNVSTIGKVRDEAVVALTDLASGEVEGTDDLTPITTANRAALLKVGRRLSTNFCNDRFLRHQAALILKNALARPTATN